MLRTWLEALRAWPLIFDPSRGLTVRGSIAGVHESLGPCNPEVEGRGISEAFPTHSPSSAPPPPRPPPQGCMQPLVVGHRAPFVVYSDWGQIHVE